MRPTTRGYARHTDGRTDSTDHHACHRAVPYRAATLGRRGIMYTIVAIFIILIIATVFFMQSRRTGDEAQAAVTERVQSINDFIHDIETDSQRAAYIAGFRTLVSMEQYVATSGQTISDPDAAFKQIFLNGTYAGQGFAIMQEQNATFDDYLFAAQEKAAMRGIVFNVTVENVTLWQADPWTVLVNYTLAMDVTDRYGTARWSLQKSFVGRVPITDLRDPLFTANSYSRLQRVIVPTNVTLFVNGNDTTGLMTHFNKSYYIAAGRGPSILMRFAGNLSDSPYGIESLVDTDDIAAQNLPVDTTRSVVDYLYFGAEATNATKATACNIQNLPPKIRLDDASLGIYQIRGRLNYTAC